MRSRSVLIYIMLTMVLILTGCNEQPPAGQSVDLSKIDNQETVKKEESLNSDPQENDPQENDPQENDSQENNSQENDSQEDKSLGNDSEDQDNLKLTEGDHIPLLASEGKTIDAFIPSGWTLIDAVDVDFNKDGFMDKVGVLEIDGSDMTEDEIYDVPRLLFAIENNDDQHYELSFQDPNLIRTRFEGGIFGDPYLEMDVSDNNFSTHAFGGSSWKWSEDNTYSYRNGEWYLIKATETYGQGPYLTSYREDDYDLGVGKRSYNSENSEIMMERGMSWDAYDLEYDIALEAPPKLKDFSAKNERAKDRIKDKRAEKVIVSDALNLSDTQVTVLKQEAKPIEQICYTDKDYIAYTFKSEDERFVNLVIYDRNLGQSTVVDRYERSDDDWVSKFDNVVIDQGYIYYNGYNSENVTYAESDDTEGTINELAFTYLYQENIDGTDKKTLFEYENKPDENGNYPYVSISFEIHAGKIIFSCYGGEETRYYRMNTDGSEMETLGSLKH